MKDEIKAIRVLPLSGLKSDWDNWSKKYQGIAAERGYLQVMLFNEHVPSDSLDINQKVENNYLIQMKMIGNKKILPGSSIRKDTEIFNLLLPSWPSNLILWQKQ